jgi:hypothetical protein
MQTGECQSEGRANCSVGQADLPFGQREFSGKQTLDPGYPKDEQSDAHDFQGAAFALGGFLSAYQSSEYAGAARDCREFTC